MRSLSFAVSRPAAVTPDWLPIACVPGEYDKALLFPVPRSHEEVVRLEGEHAQGGGLREGLVVQLANGEAAVVRRVDDATVRAGSGVDGARWVPDSNPPLQPNRCCWIATTRWLGRR